MFIERWAAGSWSRLNYLKATGMRVGLLVNFGRCGGRTKDSINLDFFRVDPCVPWLKNWFPMDMQTGFGTVVCLLAIPQDPDEHPCCVASTSVRRGDRDVFNGSGASFRPTFRPI